MARPQLEKATITVLDGARKGEVITVLFNPAEYSIDRSNAYKATAIPGLGSPILHFVNGECDQLSMELFLDDYTDPQGPTSSGASGPTTPRAGRPSARSVRLPPRPHLPSIRPTPRGPPQRRRRSTRCGRGFSIRP